MGWFVVFFALGSLTVALVWYLERLKVAMLEIPLGLRGSRLAHGLMMDLSDVEEKNLVSSLKRSTLRNTLRKHNVTIHDVYAIRWYHVVKVIYDHERRVFGRAAAIPVALLRIAALYGSTRIQSHLNEFRVGGQVVALTQSVIRGQTIRGLWFYQLEEFSRCSLYFVTVRMAIDRARALGLRFVDCGPSPENQRAAKERLGFKFVPPEQWRPGYEGPYQECPKINSFA